MTVTLAGRDSYKLCLTSDHSWHDKYDRFSKLYTAIL